MGGYVTSLSCYGIFSWPSTSTTSTTTTTITTTTTFFKSILFSLRVYLCAFVFANVAIGLVIYGQTLLCFFFLLALLIPTPLTLHYRYYFTRVVLNNLGLL